MDNILKHPGDKPFGEFNNDENFCPEYGESLVEGDIRAIVIKDFDKEKEE